MPGQILGLAGSWSGQFGKWNQIPGRNKTLNTSHETHSIHGGHERDRMLLPAFAGSKHACEKMLRNAALSGVGTMPRWYAAAAVPDIGVTWPDSCIVSFT